MSFSAMFVALTLLATVCNKMTDAKSTEWPSSFEPNRDVCDPENYNEGFAITEIKPQFMARIESNLRLLNRTLDMHEAYDTHRGDVRMYLRLKDDTLESRYIYNFHHNEVDELIEAETGERLCQTSTMGGEGSPISGILGFNSSTESGAHLFSLAGILHMATQYKYGPRTEDIVRGIPCYVYETCMPYEKKKATLKVTFYWTNEAQWSSSDDSHGLQVPLRIHVKGTGEFGPPPSGSTTGEVIEMENFYDITDFFDFQPRETDFSPPPTMYCPGRKYHGDESNQWQPSNFFSEKAEIVYWNKDDKKEHMSERTEYYDYTSHYVRYDYVKKETEEDRRRMMVIHDINTGHRYSIDITMGTCTIKELKPNGIDVTTDEDGHLQMITPADLLQHYEEYAYQGRHFERDVEAYVHSASREMFGMNLTVSVWTTSRRVEDEAEVHLGKPEPIKFMVSHPNKHSDFKPFSVNIFKYEEVSPSFHTWNIQRCFNETSMQWLRFLLDGRDTTWDIDTFHNFFMYMAHQRIAAVAGVVPIRIQSIWYDTNGLPGRIMVAFALMEHPEEPGSVDLASYPHATLAQAWENLERAVNSGDFNLTVPVVVPGSGDEPIIPEMKELLAVRGSLATADHLLHGKSPSSDGYSSGDMAAMGICMLLIGIGGVFGFFFWRSRKQ